MAAVESYDFALFVLLPEDLTEVRGEKALAVRDNVIFEFGLFPGKLGRGRNFFIAPVTPAEIKSRLPSDLSGITLAKYDPTATNLQASVGAALLQPKEAIRKHNDTRSPKSVLYEMGHTSCLLMRAISGKTTSVFLRGVQELSGTCRRGR